MRGWSPALASVIAATAFEELDIGASVHAAGEWRAIHMRADVSAFEMEWGHDLARWAYNDQCLARARSTGQLVRGEHAGFRDLFAPVRTARGAAVLVVGPFAARRPTSVETAERWHALSGQRAQLADPAFYRYLSETLATLTLEGPLLGAFEGLVTRFAALLGGAAGSERIAVEADDLKLGLLKARAVERMWDAARSMVDDRTTRIWSTPLKKDPLRGFGMQRPPEHVLVGLLGSRTDELDAVDDALRRHGAQRALAELARRRENVVCGQVGGRGIMLISAFSGGPTRVRGALLDLAARAQDCVRRFGFRLHAGIAPAAPGQSLAVRYRAAFAAAERALSRGQSLRLAGDRPEPSAHELSQLRARLSDAAETKPSLLGPRFEQYIEAAAVHAAHQLDVTRAYLEAGFERLAEPLLCTGRLDRRSFDELRASLARTQDGDHTVTDLLEAYRRAVAEIERAVQSPTAARHDRSVRRALSFLREHLSEPLTLAQVARVAGFAPAYFSRLLKRGEGATFDRYLQKLRLARAERLLAGSSLSVGRVAQLAGFRSRTYFHQAFKRYAGVTPIAYRRRKA